MTVRKIAIAITLLLLHGCIKSEDFDTPNKNCSASLAPNTTFKAVKELYKGDLLLITEDLILEGFVISSDQAGNFFGTIHLQDAAENPTAGIQLLVDLRSSYLQYPLGTKVLLKLKGLYLGKQKGAFVLGGTFAAFGTTSVGRLPALKIPEHLLVACDNTVQLAPKAIDLADIDSSLTSTLVQFSRVEVITAEQDSTYAVAETETTRTLIDCNDITIKLLNSGYANFQAQQLPSGSGTATGVLVRERNNMFLAIRDTTDLFFTQEECPDLITEFTTDSFFFTELADPNNNADARFIELYYAGNETLPLEGWSIVRYTNANTEVGASLDLSEITLTPNSFLVIAKDALEFEATFGFAPNLEAGSNSPADSNGDDNLFLIDPFGTVIDAFGRIGEDGTGTNHEFEDGKAVRSLAIERANSTYDFTEWTLYNDTGDSGTINQPQNAPEDYNPGVRD